MASGQQGYESVDPQAAVLEWRSCVPPPQRQLLPVFDHEHDRGTLSSSTFSSFNHSSSSSFSLGSTPSQPQLHGHPVESPVPQALTQAQYEQSPHHAPWLQQREPVDDPRNPQSQHYRPYEATHFSHASLRPPKPVSPVHLGLQLRYPPLQSYGRPAEGQPIQGGLEPSPEQSPGPYYPPPNPHTHYQPPRSGLPSVPFSAHAPFLLNGQPVGPRPSNVTYQYPVQVMHGDDDMYVQRNPKRRPKQPKPYARPLPSVHGHGHMDYEEDSSDGEFEPPRAVTEQQRIMQSLVDPDGKVRPHQCGECKKRFVRTEHLKRHIKAVHRGIKDFACFLCGKRCSRLDNLRQHLKLHGPRDQSPPPGSNVKAQNENDAEPSTSNAVKRILPLDEKLRCQ